MRRGCEYHRPLQPSRHQTLQSTHADGLLETISLSLPWEQGRAYGKCIGAKYMDVERGMCDREFVQFRQCMVEAVRCSLWSRRSSLPVYELTHVFLDLRR